MKECGIYIIKNTINNRVYIGKSNDIRKRWLTHKRNLKSGKHHNEKLQKDYDKCGEGAFEYKVLELCNEMDYGAIELTTIMRFVTIGRDVYNVVTAKDKLRYVLYRGLSDTLFFDEVRIDFKDSECLSEKGNPLNFAVYGRYNGIEVYVYMICDMYEDVSALSRELFFQRHKDKLFYEIVYSVDEDKNIKKIINRMLVKIKEDLGD